MFGKIKNFLYTLVTGSVTMLLSACYGPVVQDRNVPVLVPLGVKVTGTTNQPIPGMHVTVLDQVTSNYKAGGYTDVNGDASIYLTVYLNDIWYNKYFIQLEDVDGTNNDGLYLTTNLALGNSNSYNVKMSTN